MYVWEKIKGHDKINRGIFMKTPYRVISPDQLKGRKHFHWFLTYDQPYYSITTAIDIGPFYRYVKQHQLPIYLSLIYAVTNALNTIEEFRYRYYDGEIRLYDKIHPAFTVMTDVGHYDNCDDVNITGDYQQFIKEAGALVDAIKKGTNLLSEQIDVRLDQYYITSVPWISIQSSTHPMKNNEFAFIPRIAWDKFVFIEDRVMINFNLVIHHSFISGKPLADAIIAVEKAMQNPRESLR